MRLPRVQVSGVIGTMRAGNVRARALAISDSRAVVRSLFLASAVRLGLIGFLSRNRSLDEIAAHTGCTRIERLQAWLEVGTELGELARSGEAYLLRGRRAKAIAAGDHVLRAHYRSILDYQTGPYADLGRLFGSDPGDGRADLEEHADDIAQVSLAAAPFIAGYLTSAIAGLGPARILDVGCGTGVYARVAASSDPDVHVDGIDLADDVIGLARDELRAAGLDQRIHLQTGDVRQWQSPSIERYDLVLLLNNIYYFPRHERPLLYEQLRELLRPGGQLIVASMTASGSIAAAHLNFMLTCQSGASSLPQPGELEKDLAGSGFEIADSQTLVPTEPFVAITASRQ